MVPGINKISKKKDKKTKIYPDKSDISSNNRTEECKIHPGCIWSLNCNCVSCKKINM